MDPHNLYRTWLDKTDDKELKNELSAISKDASEIKDRFYRDLEFGTGGLRGIIGIGTNRMDVYTVRRATQGLADHLLGKGNTPSVCIAYDTRNKSLEFAQTAAEVLCGNGIKTYLFDSVHPTPMLSFAVRHMKADAGIVITASHNPKQYNGYKVYGADGGQITDRAAKEILACIENADYFSSTKTIPLKEALEKGLLMYIGEDVDSHYFEKIRSLSIRKELLAEKADQLKIIYSPLHGSGNIPVRRILKELGFSNVLTVPEQEKPDGDFPTTPYPNPEDPSVFDLAIKMAEKADPDLIFATDPDCDRLGVLVKDNEGKYSVLTGNQTGALLCDYIIRSRRELDMMPERPAVIKTIVTTDLAKNICEKNGVPIFDVLTGFKYIGELAEKWQNTGGHSFIFGFEESYGYLAGDFVRDKDAVIAAAQIAEMALYYKDKGQTLYQALQSLYDEYGYFAEKLISVEMPGEEGQKRCAEIIADMRANYRDMLNGASIAVVEDYIKSEKTIISTGKREKIELPRSNVLKFIFDDESWLVLRPSGTEPKVKIYVSARGGSAQEAESKLSMLEELTRGILK